MRTTLLFVTLLSGLSLGCNRNFDDPVLDRCTDAAESSRAMSRTRAMAVANACAPLMVIDQCRMAFARVQSPMAMHQAAAHCLKAQCQHRENRGHPACEPGGDPTELFEMAAGYGTTVGAVDPVVVDRVRAAVFAYRQPPLTAAQRRAKAEAERLAQAEAEAAEAETPVEVAAADDEALEVAEADPDNATDAAPAAPTLRQKAKGKIIRTIARSALRAQAVGLVE